MGVEEGYLEGRTDGECVTEGKTEWASVGAAEGNLECDSDGECVTEGRME